ncbi:SMI1/KNR4 family protein [Streptomyces sp. NBC_00328]|uniref:SMI1/KNR4 family protein n=1 Tax=Streptomyces sp. NBC_00328 TaxID=2903646 RepID=UPI002E29CE9C|nr:SMI1/KNR4 family protein [Streptomyces sp. NBC_00328]
MTSDHLSGVLERLDTWLEGNTPGEVPALNPSATQDAIDRVAEGRFSLHPDLVALLRWHNGIRFGLPHNAGYILPGGYSILPAQSMEGGQREMEQLVAWSLEEDTDEVVTMFIVADGVEIVGDGQTHYLREDLGLTAAPATAHVKWVPIGATRSGDRLVVDHRHGPMYGNVHAVAHDGTDFQTAWDSVRAMCEDMLISLEANQPLTACRLGSGYVPRIRTTSFGAMLDWEII